MSVLNPYEAPQPVTEDPPDAPAGAQSPLAADRSFWGMTATQFLGAFNDNLFKQLVLLLAVGTATTVVVSGVASPAEREAARSGPDLQSLAMFCFALPFLLFSGIAGYLSERFSKRTVIVACKVAEI